MKKCVFIVLIFALIFPSVALADNNDRVQVMGSVTVTADEVIPGDAVAVMGNMVVDGTVKGDVVAVMGNVTVNGNVGGDVVSVMGNAIINGEVMGTVTVAGGTITKGPNAKIYGSTTQVGIGEGISRFTRDFSRYGFGTNPGTFKTMKFVGILAMAAIVIILFPQGIRVAVESVDSELGKKFLIGFLSLLLLPILTVLMIITILGIPLVPILFLLVAAAVFYGYLGISIYLGRKLNDQLHLKPSPLVEYILGALPLWLIQFVPYIGYLSSTIVFLLAMGISIETRFGTRTMDRN